MVTSAVLAIVGLALVSTAFDPPAPSGAGGMGASSVQPVSYAPIRVGSDFAGALNGWSLGAGGAGARLEHRREPGSDGERGFLRFIDGGPGAVAYLEMPSAHLGDQSGLMGGTIAFDMRLVSGGKALGADWPLVRITGANGDTMSYSGPFAPGRDGWARATVEVAPGRWRIGGRVADADAMAAILADVAACEVRIEQAHGRGEVVDLDQVEFMGDYGSIGFGP